MEKSNNVKCLKCGSRFDRMFLIGKQGNADVCPVCGKPLWADKEDHAADGVVVIEENDELENGLMYFDEIETSYKERPEYNGVEVYCKECKQMDSLDLDLFDKLVDKEYVILKEGIIVKCGGCGKEHKPRKILYKRKDSYAPLLPRCPLCNSAMLKKIKTSSKVLAAATVGVFALPYNSKTYECKDCGHRF